LSRLTIRNVTELNRNCNLAFLPPLQFSRGNKDESFYIETGDLARGHLFACEFAGPRPSGR
jgi:hypothetical protein